MKVKFHPRPAPSLKTIRRFINEALRDIDEEKDFLQNVKSTGEWTDYTIEELKKKKAALMKKETRTEAEQKEVSQIQFAINAKEGDYKKKDESLDHNRKRKKSGKN